MQSSQPNNKNRPHFVALHFERLQAKILIPDSESQILPVDNHGNCRRWAWTIRPQQSVAKAAGSSWGRPIRAALKLQGHATDALPGGVPSPGSLSRQMQRYITSPPVGQWSRPMIGAAILRREIRSRRGPRPEGNGVTEHLNPCGFLAYFSPLARRGLFIPRLATHYAPSGKTNYSERECLT
jgi:hypothetical protein